MKMRLVSVTVGFVAVLALAACKSSSSGTLGGAGGSGGGAGGSGGSGGGAGGGPDCTCACSTTKANGGCADICDDMQNGNPNTPNYCNGAGALSECATCLMNSCNFSTSDIADTTACM